MAKLTGKQEPVDWSKAHLSFRELHKELHSNMSNEKFIDLYVGRFIPQEQTKEDERLRK
ncbi:hypothetical protein [Enterobacter hormaechei]|uniref:hypothetical protein n=1 Tax=Enterobacter hormaechei TaxID=158836 RepID=UPI00317D69D8